VQFQAGDELDPQPAEAFFDKRGAGGFGIAVMDQQPVGIERVEVVVLLKRRRAGCEDVQQRRAVFGGDNGSRNAVVLARPREVVAAPLPPVFQQEAEVGRAAEILLKRPLGRRLHLGP